MQGAVGLMNNVYNLVQQQNSQALTDEILRIEENMQCAPLRTHTMRNTTSRINQENIPQSTQVDVTYHIEQF